MSDTKKRVRPTMAEMHFLTDEIARFRWLYESERDKLTAQIQRSDSLGRKSREFESDARYRRFEVNTQKQRIKELHEMIGAQAEMLTKSQAEYDALQKHYFELEKKITKEDGDA